MPKQTSKKVEIFYRDLVGLTYVMIILTISVEKLWKMKIIIAFLLIDSKTKVDVMIVFVTKRDQKRFLNDEQKQTFFKIKRQFFNKIIH